MKRAFHHITACIVFLSFGVSAQDLRYTNGIFDGNYTGTYPDGGLKVTGQFKNNNRVGLWEFYTPEGGLLAAVDYTCNTQFTTIKSKTGARNALNIGFSNYADLYEFPLEEPSVVWAKRVWRDISVADLSLPRDFDFWKFLAATPTEKPLKYYFDDQFTIAGVIAQDSIPLKQEVTGFRIKLDYFFRTDLQIMDARIVGIAPLFTDENGQSGVICWIYYHGTRAVFKQLLNTRQESFDYLFSTRQLPSVVYKEQTIAAQPIAQSAVAQESARIDRELIEVENAYILQSLLEPR